MFAFVVQSNTHISLQTKPQKQRTKKMAVVINGTTHSSNHAMESLMKSLPVHSFFLKFNEGTETESMLGRIDSSHIIERTDEPTKWNKEFIFTVPINFNPAGLERSMNLLILIPKVIGITVELIVEFLSGLDLQLNLPLNCLWLHHVQF